ncbi:MAG TPA: hypothetical protein DDW27_03050 [Bacteroidales bacterium]|nr:hypothetical protein [Bacteroidales bacterium]
MSRPVRILVLATNPDKTEPLRLDEEVRGIDQALQQSRFRDNFELEQQWAVRVSDLQRLLLRYKPDIVHFSGHGSESSEIILEDSEGNSKPVPASALSKLFSLFKDNIKCVVLNACYTEVQAEAISQHISCVVGMSKAIGDDAAISFSEAFYGALGDGRDIKTAFELGCNQIDLENLDEQDTPKLKSAKGKTEEMVFVSDPGDEDRKWGSPREYAMLITTGSVCLCLVILVLGTVLGVLNGKFSPEALGGVQSAGFGGGLLGFGFILYRIIKLSLIGGTSK